jgi:YHS domain-containing protein
VRLRTGGGLNVSNERTRTRSDEVEHAQKLTGGQGRFGLAAVGRFAKHYAEMVVAMLAGMAVLGGAMAVLGGLPGDERPLVEYAYMGAAMSAPMVWWMRRMGHPWSDCWEMTASMVLPMYALVVPVALGLLPMAPMALMGWAHVAMFAGMALLMLYRWDTYANGAHCHPSAVAATSGATDPVCGMAVDPATAKRAEHAGTTYHFCSPGCRKAFQQDPTTYLAADYRPSM